MEEVAVPPFMVTHPTLVEHMRHHVRVLYNQTVYNTRLDEHDMFVGANLHLNINFDTVPVLLPQDVVESVPMAGYTEVNQRYMRYSRHKPGRFYIYAYDPNYEKYIYSLAYYGNPLSIYNNYTNVFEQRQYEQGFRYFIETSEFKEMIPSLYNMTKKIVSSAHPRLKWTALGYPRLPQSSHS